MPMPLHLKLWTALALEALFFAVLLFGAAGTIAWGAAWVYLALFFGGGAWVSLLIMRHDPALLAERMRSPVQKGQPFWDKIFLVSLIFVWCGWLVLMGLDAARFRWTVMPGWKRTNRNIGKNSR